jgi:hypothetical protein
MEKMQDVLEVYERPLNKEEPVVCLDERPVQLFEHIRDPLPAKYPGEIAKKDYAYLRCGVVNVFCAVEPKAGRHFTKVTKNRKHPEFAEFLLDLEARYPTAKTIHLVMDNLSTHTSNSLIKHFGARKGKRLWKRFTVHYSPPHGSWLNQAEIEIGLFSRQCLGRSRIPTIERLAKRTAAWTQSMNKKKIKIRWKFTRTKAKRKFRHITSDSMWSKH